MERILYTSYTFHRDKLYIYVLTAEDDADASHGRRSSTKATTRNEQDHDVSHAVGIGLLCDHVQRGICYILFRQQSYDDDNFYYLQRDNEKRG